MQPLGLLSELLTFSHMPIFAAHQLQEPIVHLLPNTILLSLRDTNPISHPESVQPKTTAFILVAEVKFCPEDKMPHGEQIFIDMSSLILYKILV